MGITAAPNRVRLCTTQERLRPRQDDQINQRFRFVIQPYERALSDTLGLAVRVHQHHGVCELHNVRLLLANTPETGGKTSPNA